MRQARDVHGGATRLSSMTAFYWPVGSSIRTEADGLEKSAGQGGWRAQRLFF
jgi:hypothetical protein